MSKNPTVLVTGGAGYIGSHALLALRSAGANLVVLDDLSTGNTWAVPEGVPLVVGDVGDPDLVAATLSDNGVDAVMHFAGSIVVPESVSDPLKYYHNNTANSRTLIEVCVRSGVRNFLFSSTAAVYGMPEIIPIEEDAVKQPINPYGASKLMTEKMLADTSHAHDFRFAVLRYFNVAGADPQGRIGQTSKESTHLIKIAAETVVGLREKMSIYGDDYETHDGTCIRDYIHVADLADAHAQVLAHLMGSNQNLTVNCGYGRGYSVREVLDAVERVTGEKLNYDIAPRRAGDPPELISSNQRIRDLVGWKPSYDDLDTIVRSAIDWERGLLARNT